MLWKNMYKDLIRDMVSLGADNVSLITILEKITIYNVFKKSDKDILIKEIVELLFSRDVTLTDIFNISTIFEQIHVNYIIEILNGVK